MEYNNIFAGVYNENIITKKETDKYDVLILDNGKRRKIEKIKFVNQNNLNLEKKILVDEKNK